MTVNKCLGSGGGSVGRAVASDSRGPQFESSHQPKNYIEHLLSTVLKKQMFDKSLPMTEFEPRITHVRGNRSTNWATTTATIWYFFVIQFDIGKLVS